ncbi:hypothetical protein K438DRAFT_706667 [Mycena galopus ATCC 62051]|nr:hypothetical protein K438DRAFT_706667 [Mycena galopus ATCC 62051]
MMTTKTVSAPPPPEGKLRIRIQFGDQFQLFNMKETKAFREAMCKFAEKIQHELSFLRFHYNGTRVRETDTPVSVRGFSFLERVYYLTCLAAAADGSTRRGKRR